MCLSTKKPSKIQQLPQYIKAIGLTNSQGNLEIIQVPLKQLAPNDLLVKVHSVSINPVDYKKLEQLRSQTVTKDNPAILGFDASGVVVKVGSHSKLFKVGDEVMYSGEYTKHGSNANFQIVDERIVGKKPKRLTHAQASAIPLVTLTAYEALVEEMGIRDDEKSKQVNAKKSILIIGGAGGVGSTAIQIAKKILGLTVIATASRNESIQYSKKMGADFVINHSKPLGEQLKEIGFESVEYIFNTVEMTTDYYTQFAQLIKPFGHIVGIVGFNEALNLGLLFLKRAKISIEMMFARSLFGVEVERQNKILDRISMFYEKGVMIPTTEMERKFSLENLLDAHEENKKGKTIGKVVLSNVQEFFK